MMRVALVASHPVQYYAPLFRALAQRLEVTVFYGHNATKKDQAEAGFGVGFEWDVDLLSGYRSEFLTNTAKVPSVNRFGGVDTPEVGGRLRAGKFDAVLLFGWHLKCYLQALVAAKRAHIPAMVRGDSHLDTPRASWKRWGKRLAYPSFLSCFDAALVVGERNRAYWRHYGYPESRMFYSPHCVDNDWFAARATAGARSQLRAQLGVRPDAKLALFAGKLLDFKRPLDLLEAVAQVRAAGVAMEMMVAGAGPLEAELGHRAKRVGVPIHLLGFQNQSDMPVAYAASDMLVLPSDGRETWGLVVNEALACGRPVLVSDAVGCAPDVAAQLGSRLIFPRGDVNALAMRLCELIAAPLEADEIAAAAACFSVAAAAEGICNALVGSAAATGLSEDKRLETAAWGQGRPN